MDHYEKNYVSEHKKIKIKCDKKYEMNEIINSLNDEKFENLYNELKNGDKYRNINIKELKNGDKYRNININEFV